MLACRVSPKQKALIVTIIRERCSKNDEKVTTLAIGDGANDVNMITAAHIGVGISGLEGQQAARASDYSIGQFKFLKTLMFQHGREAYRRNSYMILYMFYKNVLYVFPFFYYGFLSWFSGINFYDNFMYQCYNVLFTGLPVVWYCTFDFEHTKEKFMSEPLLYKIGLRNYCFNKFQFFRWYFYGVWQCALILFLTFRTFEETSDTYRNNYVSGSLILDGNFMLMTFVYLVTVKIFISTNTHYVIGTFCYLFGVFLFFI